MIGSLRVLILLSTESRACDRDTVEEDGKPLICAVHSPLACSLRKCFGGFLLCDTAADIASLWPSGAHVLAGKAVIK